MCVNRCCKYFLIINFVYVLSLIIQNFKFFMSSSVSISLYLLNFKSLLKSSPHPSTAVTIELRDVFVYLFLPTSTVSSVRAGALSLAHLWMHSPKHTGSGHPGVLECVHGDRLCKSAFLPFSKFSQCLIFIPGLRCVHIFTC